MSQPVFLFNQQSLQRILSGKELAMKVSCFSPEMFERISKLEESGFPGVAQGIHTLCECDEEVQHFFEALHHLKADVDVFGGRLRKSLMKYAHDSKVTHDLLNIYLEERKVLDNKKTEKEMVPC